MSHNDSHKTWLSHSMAVVKLQKLLSSAKRCVFECRNSIGYTRIFFLCVLFVRCVYVCVCDIITTYVNVCVYIL